MRVFSFSYAAAGNTVMSYGRWITAGNIAVAEFAFRTHLYLHIGGLDSGGCLHWNGIGPTNLQVTGRGLYIIRARHGIRSLMNK